MHRVSLHDLGVKHFRICRRQRHTDSALGLAGRQVAGASYIFQMQHSDDWIEDRIRWCARKHKLPTGRTQFWSGTDAAIQQVVAHAARNVDAGRPVVLAYESQTKWTLIGTRQTVCTCDDWLRSLSHTEIHDIRSRDYPPPQADWESLWPQMGQLKMSWDMLLVTDARGEEEVLWVPPGGEAFAIWNLLRMLGGLCR